MYPDWPSLDNSVVELFLKGDENAFSIIYHSFAPGLLSYAHTICGSREQAEDIIQDVFVVCWEKREQIKAEHLNGWLIKVTKNMAVKAFRRNVLITEYIIDDNTALTEEENTLLQEEKAMKIVNSLPPERRKIFLLSRVQQKSYREIADELGISVRTVENQISSALKHIRYEATIALLISLLTLR